MVGIDQEGLVAVADDGDQRFTLLEGVGSLHEEVDRAVRGLWVELYFQHGQAGVEEGPFAEAERPQAAPLVGRQLA